MKQKILLVSLDPNIADPFKTALIESGYNAQIKRQFYSSDREPVHNDFDMVITLWSCVQIEDKRPVEDTRFIDALFLTKNAVLSNRVQMYQDGVYRFDKGNDGTQKFVRTVNSLLSSLKTSAECRGKAQSHPKQYKPTAKSIIGASPQMKELRRLVLKISQSPAPPVLITGETGTGKELVADVLHYSGPRAKQPFIKINCSAIPENLLESQLFGHIKGAFTGASKDQTGLFEKADSGTVLLDEIGDMSLNLQPKLLRFLETRRFHRVGSVKEKQVDVRVLAATNARLPELVEKDRFRADLYYRLNVLKVEMPPLRERPQDTPRLIRFFLKKEKAGNILFPPEIMEFLSRYDWPGNVRELRNVLRYICYHKQNGTVTEDDLPDELKNGTIQRNKSKKARTLQEIEKEHVLSVFRENGRQIRTAARILGIDRNTLKRKLEKYGVTVD